MSLSNLIVNLLSGVGDPKIRSEVSSSIWYLYEVYARGRASDEEIKNDLFEICSLVLSLTRTDLIEEELRKEAWRLADELLRAFKIESLRRRLMLKFAPRPSEGGPRLGGLL